jgi:hypothetical protein
MSKGLQAKSLSPDAQDALRALLRAARRAREIAYQTKTPLVIVRDGILVQEYVTDLEASLRELDEHED